ncbi:HD domain-containing phosphohydrolase [Intrasporangium sp.]|uniref:HD domain-containing phosphohydrolase n=1 Tax=Intrasporangium sp. TaxID=1925024 RepID=UPI0032214900
MYVLAVACAALALGTALLVIDGPPPWTKTALFVVMGLVSQQLRVPDVGFRSAISFLSVILLASGVIVGPFAAWLVGVTAVLPAVRRTPHWYQSLYNMAMCAIIATLGGLSYRLLGGAVEVATLSGAAEIALHVGLPLLVADVVLCVSNAVLLAAVMRIDQGHPFGHLVRQMLATTGPTYIGYGIIGFLFVVLWYPAGLGPASALYVFAPLLVARWAFIQYVDETRSHTRTVDTLVTALGTKLPVEVEQSRRAALVAEWIAEQQGLPAQQVATVQHVAMLHRLGDLGLERAVRSVNGAAGTGRAPARDRLAARMIDGIEFLEPAGAGIEHQADAYDGSTGALAGGEIPMAARIVAVAVAFEALAREVADPVEAFRRVEAEAGGRFDPSVVGALRAALQRHPWPPTEQAAEQEVPA